MLRHLVFYRNLLRTFNFIDAVIIVCAIKLNFRKIYLPFGNKAFFIRKETKEKYKEVFNSKIYNIKLPLIPKKKLLMLVKTWVLQHFFFKSRYKQSEIVALEIESENCDYFYKKLKNITI